MSIEIEVGLENAPRVPLTLEELPKETPKGLKNPKVQRLMVAGAILVLAVAVGLFLHYRNRESTDDAQVDGHITPIAAKISAPRRRSRSSTRAKCWAASSIARCKSTAATASAKNSPSSDGTAKPAYAE